MTSYATVAELKTYVNEMTGGVQTSFTTDENDLLQVFLDEATAELDKETGRTFAGVTATRYFYSKDVEGDTLFLDADLLSVTTLTNGNGVTIAGTNYTLQPDNWTPKQKIKLKSGYSWEFDTDGRISVAGSWGFSTTPAADVKRAAKRLAYFYWLKRGATGEATVLNETQTTEASEYPADVVRVIRRYKRGNYR